MRLTFYIAAIGLGLSMASCGGPNPFATFKIERTPEIILLTPAKRLESADESYKIKVAFSDVRVDDSWSITYMSDATTVKGTAVIEDLPITAQSIVWDTSNLPDGEYFLSAKLSTKDGVDIHTPADGTVNINHPGIENAAPTISLTYPKGGETFTPGSTETILFSASDPDGDTMTYKVEISADDGDTWAILGEDLTSTSFTWVIGSDQDVGLFYRVRVSVTDDDNTKAHAVVSKPFQILADTSS